MRNSLTHLHLVFGKITMLRRESFASYLEVAARSFLKVAEVDSEGRSIFYSAETRQLLRVSFWYMSIKLRQEASTHQARVVQLSV
jgi:phenylalanine-4-hydroxylase